MLKSFFVYSIPEFQLVQPTPILPWASEASAFGRPGSFPQRCVLWGGAPSLPPHRPKLGQQSEDFSDYGEAVGKLRDGSRFEDGPEMLVILMIEALLLRMFSV